MTEIICDTSVIIGFGWVLDSRHYLCEKFFQRFPIDDSINSFFYTKKAKEEVERKEILFRKKYRDYRDEIILLQIFIQEFLSKSREIDYQKSEYPWNDLYWKILVKLTECLDCKQEDVSYDANIITDFTCFCLDRRDCSDHFFITADDRTYKCRRILREYVCKEYDDEIPLNIRSVREFR